MKMSLTRQKIWDAGDENYVDGPDLIAGTRSFAGYCSPQSIAKSKNKIGINRSKTTIRNSGNDPLYLDEDGHFRARRPLRPTGNQFVGFKRGCMVTSKLWLTTYPFMDRSNNNLLGETVLFHVHSSVPAIEEPPEAPAASWIASWLPKIGLDLPEIISPWRKPITDLQIAPAAPSHHDIADIDQQQRPKYIVNHGPILRANIDVLYLDKSFWRQYFDRCPRGPDIFVPGVYPKDLAQVQRVAVDIAVLRNRDEFAAVVRALRRHLPNLISFQAVVTKIIPRSDVEPEEQIAILEDGLYGIYVSLEERVRLGVHESVDHVPSQGIVSENLDRLNVLATGSFIQTRYMLLAYYDDALQGLHGGSPEVDLPVGAQGPVESSSPALNLKKREIKSPVSPATKARRKNNSQSPTTYRNRRGSISTHSKSRSSGRSTPSTGKSPDLPLRKHPDRRHETSTTTPSSTKSPKDDKTNINNNNKKISKSVDNTTPRQNTDTKSNKPTSLKTPAKALLHEIRDTAPLFSPRRTPEQLAATRRAQEPARQAFLSDHPHAYLRIATSGEGALCAWRAIQASWTAALPRLARVTRLPEATLRGIVNVETLEEERLRDREEADVNLRMAGVVDERNFTVDYAARVFRRLVWRRTGLPMDLGCIGPLQREAFGGSIGDLFYMVLGGPSSRSEGGRGGDEQQQQQQSSSLLAPAVSRVWIWNNNEPGVGHYEGIRDV